LHSQTRIKQVTVNDNWKRIPVILVVLIFFITGCGTTTKIVNTEVNSSLNKIGDPIIGKEALIDTITAILNDPALLRASIAAKVVNAETGEIIFEKDSKKLMHPASNTKIFTVSAALLYLGPEYTFKTKILIDSTRTLKDTLDGDIYLVGSGDPAFGLADLKIMIDVLFYKGIRHIAGDIICDDYFFDDLQYGSGWMWDDQPYFGFSPMGALTINWNMLQVNAAPADTIGLPAEIKLFPQTNYVQINNQSETIDSLTFIELQNDTSLMYKPFSVMRRWQTQENVIDVEGMILAKSNEIERQFNIVDPTFYFGTLFKEYCEQKGISIAGKINRGVVPNKTKTLSVAESPSVAALIYEMNKRSDNLYAELLLKAVGAKVKGTPGSSEKGVDVINEMLTGWSVNPKDFKFVDGSGVSRYNLVNPDAIIELLLNMYNNFSVRHEFIASLPIAGIDGTLEDRMKNSAAFNKLHAKTGTLSGVTTLAGYTTTADDNILAFSIMMSHFTGSAKPLRDIQDKICDAISRLKIED